MALKLRVPAVDDPDFIAELELRGEPTLRLVGSADRVATRELELLLETVHGELRSRRVREVVVDMHALDAMHTSCFKVLSAWLAKVQDLDERERYRIRVRTNPSIAWQKHALPALSYFDTSLVKVE